MPRKAAAPFAPDMDGIALPLVNEVDEYEEDGYDETETGEADDVLPGHRSLPLPTNREWRRIGRNGKLSSVRSTREVLNRKSAVLLGTEYRADWPLSLEQVNAACSFIREQLYGIIGVQRGSHTYDELRIPLASQFMNLRRELEHRIAPLTYACSYWAAISLVKEVLKRNKIRGQHSGIGGTVSDAQANHPQHTTRNSSSASATNTESSGASKSDNVHNQDSDAVQSNNHTDQVTKSQPHSSNAVAAGNSTPTSTILQNTTDQKSDPQRSSHGSDQREVSLNHSVPGSASPIQSQGSNAGGPFVTPNTKVAKEVRGSRGVRRSRGVRGSRGVGRLPRTRSSFATVGLIASNAGRRLAAVSNTRRGVRKRTALGRSGARIRRGTPSGSFLRR